MGRLSRQRWILAGVLLAAVVIGGSVLAGMQTSEAKRWVFGGGFAVDEVDVSGTGDFFVTASSSAGAAAGPGTTVLHYFRGESVSWNASVEGPVTALAIAGSGALVAAGLEGGGIRLFTGRGVDLGTAATQGPVHDIDVSADGGLIAAVTGLTGGDAAPGGLVLFRLGRPLPLLHSPKDDFAAVTLSEDGAVLVAAARGARTTTVLLYDRDVTSDRPRMTETLPGVYAALDVSSDGRHVLVVTETAAFLLSREHTRPVGMVPPVPDAVQRHAGGALAPDGQSYLLVDDERRTVSLHKWGEGEPRWRHGAAGGVVEARLDADGERAAVVSGDGRLTILSVTTGRPLKDFRLVGDPGDVALSADGRYVLASDDAGRLYRARSGYTGILGALPDPIVSTLYAQPPIILWVGVAAAALAVATPLGMPGLSALAPLLARRARMPASSAPSVPTPLVASSPRPSRRIEGPILLDGVSVQRRGRTILHDVSVALQPGTLTAVVGGSGEGKSTLLGALLGNGVVHGSVLLGDFDPRRAPRRARDEVGFVAQDLQLYESLTPLENLLAFGGQFDLPEAELAGKARRLLADVGLDPALSRQVGTLSGGERRRVSIAVTLLHAPALLVLDEPTTGLDPLTRRQLWALLRGLRERTGVTVVVSTHYLEEAEAADEVVVLEDGRVLASGPPSRIVETAPGGPALWRVAVADPAGREGAPLADALRAALRAGDAEDAVRDLEVVQARIAVMRLADPPAGAALALRALRAAGFGAADAGWTPMRFEEAFVAHIAEARRVGLAVVPAAAGPSAVATSAEEALVVDASDGEPAFSLGGDDPWAGPASTPTS